MSPHLFYYHRDQNKSKKITCRLLKNSEELLLSNFIIENPQWNLVRSQNSVSLTLLSVERLQINFLLQMMQKERFHQMKRKVVSHQLIRILMCGHLLRRENQSGVRYLHQGNKRTVRQNNLRKSN